MRWGIEFLSALVFTSAVRLLPGCADSDTARRPGGAGCACGPGASTGRSIVGTGTMRRGCDLREDGEMLSSKYSDVRISNTTTTHGNTRHILGGNSPGQTIGGRTADITRACDTAIQAQPRRTAQL